MRNRRSACTDPRRFGAVLWHGIRMTANWMRHTCCCAGSASSRSSKAFTGALLHREPPGNAAPPIKQVLLAGDIVVGVGNIYACESLFRAGINPKTPRCPHFSRARYERLAVRRSGTMLAAAIVARRQHAARLYCSQWTIWIFPADIFRL